MSKKKTIQKQNKIFTLIFKDKDDNTMAIDEEVYTSLDAATKVATKSVISGYWDSDVYICEVTAIKKVIATSKITSVKEI